jgi:hypothetical protein
MSTSNDGYSIIIYWRAVVVNDKPAKELVLKVNEKEFILHPWLGERLEYMNTHPTVWVRDTSYDYVPDDLNEHLKKIGESKSQKRIHMENKRRNKHKE